MDSLGVLGACRFSTKIDLRKKGVEEHLEILLGMKYVKCRSTGNFITIDIC